ncbi:MAG: hypothetical protein EBU46_17910 [Nitrosomonadaceae bacterium]|nr:hypothetical protein [Nitrosomonadaceae bacterium]
MSRLDVRDAINSAADWAGSAPAVRKLVGNPFSAALLLTAMVGVVIMAVFHYKLTGENWRASARAAFYIYAATTLLLFLHYSLAARDAQSDCAVGGARGVVSDIVGSRAASVPGYVPVLPGIKGGAGFEWPPAAGGDYPGPPLTLAQGARAAGGASILADVVDAPAAPGSGFDLDLRPVQVKRVN